MESFDSILLNGKPLRPAPFVSTTYEYTKSGIYNIGGFLIVTLTGILVDEDILSKINELNNLQNSQDCVNLIIGCAGSQQPEFLNGAGRITSIDISQGDEPYVASYTMVIKIETINGQPAVDPDPDFARSIGVSSIPRFLIEYSENITIDGEGDIISSHDNNMNISKANMKISGSIIIKTNASYICGMPSYNPEREIESLLIQRSQSLLEGIGQNNPIAGKYASWKKILDTKSLEIQNNGTVTWQFNCYILQSGGTGVPLAFIDVNTTDKKNQKTNFDTKTISGTINGLSSATIGDHIGHKADTNERYSNAQSAFTSLQASLNSGQWPGEFSVIAGEEGVDCGVGGCIPFIPPKCYQRVSHNITSSVVTGQISFDMEFADRSSCENTEFDIEATIDENLPVNIIQEIIVPSRAKGRSIIQKTGGSSHTVNVVVRGNLKGCNEYNMPLLITSVLTRMNGIITGRYPGFFIKKQSTVLGTFSYTSNVELIKCDLIT